MTVGAETPTAEAWLHGTLTAYAPLVALVGTRIYEDVAPPDAGYPFVVFTYLGGADIRGNGSRRFGVSALYAVKAVDQVNTYAPLRSVAAAIDAALHRATGAVAGEGSIWGCVREAPVRMTDPDGFRHLGGTYRIWLTNE